MRFYNICYLRTMYFINTRIAILAIIFKTIYLTTAKSRNLTSSGLHFHSTELEFHFQVAQLIKINKIFETSVADAENLENPCHKTWIYTSDSNSFRFGPEIIFPAVVDNPRVLVVDQIKEFNNKSYFNREFEYDDVMFPYHFGAFKFHRSCAVVLVQGKSAVNNVLLTKSLLSRKLVRPQEDYFIHIVKTEDDLKLLQQEFDEKIRYQNYVVIRHSVSPTWISGCDRKLKPLVYGHRCNLLLNDKLIVVAVTVAPERTIFRNNPDGSLLHGEGVYFEMLQVWSRIHNFTLKLQNANDGTGGAGKKNKNGTWGGGAGDVFRGEANFAITLGATASRHRILDFSAAMDRYTRIFYIPAPLVGISWKALFRPLSPMLWLSVLITAVATILAAYVCFNWSFNSKTRTRISRMKFQNVLGIYATIILEQSTKATSWVGLRTRSILILWLMFNLVIGTSYRSKLVSFLTKPEPILSVPKLHKELVYSDYTLFFRYYGGAVYSYISNSNSPIHKEMLKRIVLVKSSSDCITLALLTQQAACLDYAPAGDFAVTGNATLYSSHVKKAFVTSEDSDLSVAMVWAFAKGSPLVQEFDKLILNSMASGLHDHWIHESQVRNKIQGSRWLRSQKESLLRYKLEEIHDMDRFSGGLSLSSLYGPFILTIIGLSTSLSCFILEILQKCRHSSKSSPNSLQNSELKGEVDRAIKEDRPES